VKSKTGIIKKTAETITHPLFTSQHLHQLAVLSPKYSWSRNSQKMTPLTGELIKKIPTAFRETELLI
jgi:hypothetical protein